MKGKMIKISLLLVLLVTIFIVILMCIANRNKQSIYLNEKKSYLSEFNIVDDEVHITCYVTICNTYNTNKTVLIKGDFSNEVKSGLMSDEVLYAIDSKERKSEFTLRPKEEKSFYVTFIGSFSGTKQMTSRRLPPITIEEVLHE